MLRYIHILEEGRYDGIGHVVEDAFAQFKAQAEKGDKREAIEVMELGIRLLSIKDPLEGALARELSKVWPEGVTAE